jgi:voltage-gated potassium channel
VPPDDARDTTGAVHVPLTGSGSVEAVPGRGVLVHEYTRFVWGTTRVLVLLTACYYLLPAESPWQDSVAGSRWAASLLSLCGGILVLRNQLRSARTVRSVRARAEAVLTALYLLVLVFAVTYDRMARSEPDQFSGIHNQTDALYFTLTITSTVGFGDITPVGTAARAVVTLHMLVNLIYVGLALRVLATFSTPSTASGRPPAQGWDVADH